MALGVPDARVASQVFAVANISLFALLKQQRTEACSARALRLSFELAWLGCRP